MVQGSPAVRWTPDNNHKLLQALVIIHAGAPDYKKIASVFGPDVPTEAIQYRIRTLRKEGAALGISGTNSSPTNPSQRTATSTGKKASNGRKRKAPASEDIDDDEALARQLRSPSNGGNNTLLTSKTPEKAQKVLNGRVTKARKSPRSTIKKDYMALEDPFIGSTFLNSDGEKIFPTDHSDSEDLFESDKGYDGKYEDGQEMEGAV